MTTKPIFQRRHYEAIARVLREVKAHDVDAMRASAIRNRFSDMFLGDNESFNPARFRAACNEETKE